MKTKFHPTLHVMFNLRHIMLLLTRSSIFPREPPSQTKEKSTSGRKRINHPLHRQVLRLVFPTTPPPPHHRIIRSDSRCRRITLFHTRPVDPPLVLDPVALAAPPQHRRQDTSTAITTSLPQEASERYLSTSVNRPHIEMTRCSAGYHIVPARVPPEETLRILYD
jgi:hypothetical protein